MVTTTWILGSIGLCVAVYAAIRTRSERLLIRILSCVVVAVVWMVARDRRDERAHLAPRRVQAITTGTSLDESSLRGQLGVGGLSSANSVAFGSVVHARAATGLAMARARFGRAGAMPLVVWTDPIEREVLAGDADPSHGVRALTAVQPPPIEPADFELRLLAPLRAGRPGALELRLSESLPNDVSVETVVIGPGGDEVVRHTSQIREASGTEMVAFDVASAGHHTIRLFANTESGTRVTSVSDVEAGAAPRVAVLGAGGADSATVTGVANLVSALAVQGVDAVALAADAVTDPSDLEGFAAVLAATRLGEQTQIALGDFVDAGGGLFVVADPRDGGALPRPGEPLHASMPVEVRPFMAPESGSDGEGAGETGDAGTGDDAAGGDGTTPPVEPESELESETETGLATEPPTAEPPVDPQAVGEIEGAVAPDPGTAPVEVERRQVALVLVIDQSGSMSREVTDGVSRMDFAKRSAFETADALDEEDLLAILSFDATSYELVPLGVRPSRQELEAGIRKLAPLGGITLPHTGMSRAKDILTSIEVAAKHVILLTDGDRIGDSTLAATARHAREIATAGGTVSVVHIVTGEIGDVDGDLRFVAAVAREGRGQYHHTQDASRVPRIILTEVQRVLGAVGRGASPGTGSGGQTRTDSTDTEPVDPQPADADPVDAQPADPDPLDPESADPEAAQQQSDPEDGAVDPPEGSALSASTEPEPPGAVEPTIVVRAVYPDSPLLVPVPEVGYPKLRGLADVAGRADAQTLLVAGDIGVPLLAFANRGLGRIGAWTADFGAAGAASWGTSWREDAAFPARLAQWVSYLLPPPPNHASNGDPRVLRTRDTLEPAAPTRAELERLRAESGGRDLSALDGFDLDRVLSEHGEDYVTTSESRAADDALWALLAIALLAAFEFVVRRRGVFRIGPSR